MQRCKFASLPSPSNLSALTTQGQGARSLGIEAVDGAGLLRMVSLAFSHPAGVFTLKEAPEIEGTIILLIRA